MALFLLGLVILFVGYFTYGKLVERQVEPDGRITPAVKLHDGVDYVSLPHWKNMLIQLLNIAGVGPVIGVILGVKFGSIVFIIIPIGNIIAGATHDFLSGMMSLRNDGANLPFLIRANLGKVYYGIFSAFMAFLLLLVVAVFINVPAGLFAGMIPLKGVFWTSVVLIFVYYIAATLFPIDKIIGRAYPVFGALLVIGTFIIFVTLMIECAGNPSLLAESDAFRANMWNTENGHPIIPLLFVTISCGIISGFHATQSPIIARTMVSERQAKSSFYGMMVLEGVIAMIWAAAGLAIYNIFPEQMKESPTSVLIDITTYFLGSGIGAITVLGIIILAITSGDTAMRSLRLSMAEIAGISQKKIGSRLLLCMPIIVIVAILLWWSNTGKESFAQLWNYFAWGNQVLAASTLMAASVWLFRRRKNGLIAMVPGIFMMFIVLSYIIWISPTHGGPPGFGLDLEVSYALAIIFTLAISAWVWKRGHKSNPKNSKGDDNF